MTPALLNLLLWVPFLAVLFVSGLIFCISGYKKGLWRALISLGVTVVSALLSMLLSNLIAHAIAPSLIGRLPIEDITNKFPLPASLVLEFIRGIIGCIVALVMFSVFLFVLTLILKLVANAIKREALITPEKGYKLGGLGVRFVDAVLYTILLTLPLYGSIQAYAPTIQTMMEFADIEENAEITAYIDVLASHPVALMTKPTPIAAIYKGIQNFKVAGSTVNIPQIAETVNKTITMIKDLATKDPSEFEDGVLELIDYLKKNVVDKDWAYTLFNEVLSELKAEIPLDPDSEFAQTFLPMLEMSEEDFNKTSKAALDILELMVRNDMINMAMNGKLDADVIYESGLLAQILRIVNTNDQLVAFKSMIVKEAVTEMFNDDKAMADKFLKTVNLEKLTDDKQLAEEVKAIAVNIKSSQASSVLEFIVRHPMFTDESLDMVLDNFKLSYMIGIEEGSALANYIDSDEVRSKLLAKLHECAVSDVNGPHFGDYCNAITAIDAVYSDALFSNNNDLLSKGGDAIRFALELLDPYIAKNYPDADPMLRQLIEAAADAADKAELPQKGCSIDGVAQLVKIYRLITVTTPDETQNDKLINALYRFYWSDNAYKLVEVMAKDGSDPLGLKLTANQKAMLKDGIDALLEKFDIADANNGMSSGSGIGIIVGGSDIGIGEGGSGSVIIGGSGIGIGEGNGVIIGGSGISIGEGGSIIIDGNVISDLDDIFKYFGNCGYPRPENETEITASLIAFFGL